MYWQEKSKEKRGSIPDDIIDMVFYIRCKHLPVDHAWPLAEALLAELPWLKDETGAGVHPIQISEEGNGWFRPDDPDALLHLSRRTRLILRIPKTRQADAELLLGKTLEVAGHELELVKVTVRHLSALTTLISRYVVVETGNTEQEFVDRIAQHLLAMGVQPRKMLPGRERILRTPEATLVTRSLMLADTTLQESLNLQQQGLGQHRHLGCGLFIPQKEISDITPEQLLQ